MLTIQKINKYYVQIDDKDANGKPWKLSIKTLGSIKCLVRAMYIYGYKKGFKDGVKQEKRRQTIAYNKACDKFGI